MTTIYYVRHGKTDDNINDILTGQVDVSLNEYGIKQAEETAKELENVKFNVAFCSPLKRAKQTADIINKNHNLKFNIENRLIERDYGVFTGKNTKDIDREISWNYYLCDKQYKNLESPKQMYKRVSVFLDEIKRKYKNKNILVVAHSGVGRIFRVYFDGIPDDGNLLKLTLKNAEVLKFEL